MITVVREKIGDIDILVNNAGAILVGPAENQETEAFEDTMQTNFWGPFFAIREVVPQMKRRRFGRIVNIASIGGKVAFPHLLLKRGILNTHSIRSEFGREPRLLVLKSQLNVGHPRSLIVRFSISSK